MFFVWFLAAAGVVLLWMLVKRLIRGSAAQRNPNLVQQTRPVPDLSSPMDAGSRDRTQSNLLNLATESSSFDHGRRSAAAIPSAAAMSSVSGNDAAGRIPTATIPMEATGKNRRSTWDNHRLFNDFDGILSDGRMTLPLPAPEDLPIGDDDFVFGSLTPSIAQLLPETAARRDSQRKDLVGAGYHSRASWLNLTAIRFVLAFLALAIVGFWLLMAPPALEPWLLALVVMAPMFMWALPPLVVAWKSSERKIDIERGLPDVLDMMNMGVSQGLTVQQSLSRISREVTTAHPPLAEELRIVTHQAEVGSLHQALRNFAQRVDSPEVNSFTSLLIQSEATGTSISRALTEYSDSMRASLKERADARANAASFKLLFPIALCLMPSVFLFLLGPAIVQMSDFFANQGQQLQQNRADAIRSLDQQPQLDFSRLNAGQFGGPQ